MTSYARIEIAPYASPWDLEKITWQPGQEERSGSFIVKNKSSFSDELFAWAARYSPKRSRVFDTIQVLSMVGLIERNQG